MGEICVRVARISLQPILLGAGQRALVRQDHAPIERLEAHGREEAATGEHAGAGGRARQAKLLFVDVEARGRRRGRRIPSPFQACSRRAASA